MMQSIVKITSLTIVTFCTPLLVLCFHLIQDIADLFSRLVNLYQCVFAVPHYIFKVNIQLALHLVIDLALCLGFLVLATAMFMLCYQKQRRNISSLAE